MIEEFLNSLNEEFLMKIEEKMKSYQRVPVEKPDFVDYLPGTSIHLWFNNESTNYANHWHPNMEVIMPLQDNYMLVSSNQTYRLNPGDILIIPGGELHQLSAPSTGCRLIFIFNFSVISKIPGGTYLVPMFSHPVLISGNTDFHQKQIQHLLTACQKYFEEDTLGELTVYSHLLNFFIDYGNEQIRLNETFQTTQKYTQQELLNKLNVVLNYIDEHFTEDITLESTAQAAGFSKFYFSHIFKQYSGSGYSFHDYLNLRRIRNAETLLQDPNLSITEIALQSGFGSLVSFNRTFKRFKQCTPSVYRAAIKE
ncbi:helix-turn-helix transcriptional regulator [Eisenbergiella porci]|uniref:helix-turn-helix transcriptional regulator n=1 Tax=Eisenbergiella porci TaxID=2652274 RepID=UPI002A81EB77|nr:AraC family transcriptional regulator [Eisenbergiella porci]